MQTRPSRSTTEVTPCAAASSSQSLALLASAAPASAAVPHTVQPGETLWSIAAANNLTTRTVAAFNGLSEDAQVVLGSTIMVPSTVEGYAALQQAGLVPVDPAAAPPPPGRPGRRAWTPPRRRRPAHRRPPAGTPCGPATRSPPSPPARASPSPTWRR